MLMILKYHMWTQSWLVEIIRKLESEYEVKAELTKTRRKLHEYLGMTFDFKECCKVNFSMTG